MLGSRIVRSGQILSGQVGQYHLASGVLNTVLVSGATSTRAQFLAPFVSGSAWAATTEEVVSGVRSVTLSLSGNVVVAMAGVSGRMPAIGLVVDNALSGAPVNLYTVGVFQLSSGLADFSGYLGQQLFVGRSGHVVTVSGSFNSGGLLSGDALQPLGYATNSGGLVLSVAAGLPLVPSLIYSGNIGSGSVGWPHLASGLLSGIIQSGSVGSGSVIGRSGGGWTIASGSISQFDIAAGGVGSGNIASGAISSGMLASGLIANLGGASLTSGSVQSGHIASGAVEGFFGPTRQIASGSVGVWDLGSGAVIAGALGSGAVQSGNIASGVVASGMLASGLIANLGGGALASGAVQSGHVASGAVQGFFGTTRQIASGTLGVWDLGSGAVIAGTVGSGAVQSGSIASGQLGISHFQSGLVLSGLIKSGGVGSGAVPGSLGGGYFVIASGTLGPNDLGSGSVLSGSIASGQVGSFHLASGSVTSGKIASGQIGPFHLQSGLQLSGLIQSGGVGSGAVTGQAGGGYLVIASGSVGTFDIASGAVVSGQVASGAIHQFSIALNSVKSGLISSGCIGSYHLSSGTLADRAQYMSPFSSGLGRAPGMLTGETVSGVRAVAVSQSGFLQVAMASVSGRMPAVGVVLDNVASGIQANVFTQGDFQPTSGLVDYSGVFGQLLYVGRSGQVVTASGWFNSGGLLSGDITQPLGNLVGSGWLLLGMGALPPFVAGPITSGNIGSGQVGLFHLQSGLQLSGLIWSGGVGSGAVKGSLGGGYFTIASGTLGPNDLASGSVLSGAIASGQVGSFAIASGGVLSGNVASGQLGLFHLQSGLQISGLVLSGGLGSGAVGTTHIASGTVVTNANYALFNVSGLKTGEAISGVRAVSISLSGFFQIAMTNMSGRMPVVGVVTVNLASGDPVSGAACFTQGTFQLGSGISYFPVLGTTVFAGRSGHLVTFSGSWNSGGFVSGDIAQSLGVTYNSGGLWLNVAESWPGGFALSGPSRLGFF